MPALLASCRSVRHMVVRSQPPPSVCSFQMVKLNWQGGMAFEAEPPSGCKLVMDSSPDHGGERRGPSPMETLLSSLAACSAMDVISILEKKRQVVTSYEIEIEGDRPPQGTYPRPYTSIRIKHLLSGDNLDPTAVARAIQLSDEKYCSVAATLQRSPNIESSFEIR